MISLNIFIGFISGLAVYFISLLIGIEVSGGVPELINLYHNNMRGYFFSAFLGISSFLLSLLTFVVINLKEKMFDSEDYKNMYVICNGLSGENDIVKKNLYKPLVIISTLLVISILCSIITAILQFTLGISNNKLVLIAPTIFPFLSISFMTLSLFQMAQLIYQWLNSEGVISKK
ncbi:hypothetical protein [Providencia stuartii]|uniref:hypothetical protein n=1 Tax=Providencia stuartii TaxID=588 RepID=UPI003323F2FC